MFNGRKIAIATMHKKEEVISPLIIKHLGVIPLVPEINTDVLGTFSGEVERKKSSIETARKKCNIAMNLSGLDLAISSEGSFGNSLIVPFVSANEEVILLIDRKHKQEFIGKEITVETNFSGVYVSSSEEAFEFARKIGFPEHGVIIKNRETNFNYLFKGINSESELKEKINILFQTTNSVWIETDMRAMYNPTRMKAIKKATQNLIEKLNSKCPVCAFPGFWINEFIRGLNCSYCGFPTKSIKAYKYQCKKCNYSILKDNFGGKAEEDPMYCDVCNP